MRPSGEDFAEIIPGSLLWVNQEIAHIQADVLAHLNAHAVVRVGDNAQFLAAAKVNTAVVHVAQVEVRLDGAPKRPLAVLYILDMLRRMPTITRPLSAPS